MFRPISYGTPLVTVSKPTQKSNILNDQNSHVIIMMMRTLLLDLEYFSRLFEERNVHARNILIWAYLYVISELEVLFVHFI